MAFNFAKPTNKVPQTKPSAKTGKRTRRTQNLGIATPHKGATRSKTQSRTQRYPQQ